MSFNDENPGCAAVSDADHAQVWSNSLSTEALMRNIWVEVLRSPDLGLDDNLYQAGADSFSVLYAVHKCQDVFGIELTPSDALKVLLEVPTVNALSQYVRVRLQQQGEHADAGSGARVEGAYEEGAL